jgi:glycosidase
MDILESVEHMKNKIVVLLVLLTAACTRISHDQAPTVFVATPLTPSIVPASATPFPPTSTAVPSPTPTQAPVSQFWWDDSVFYELTVRSFFDSNGDGIGDFIGLIEKLDYLNDGDPNTTTDLGVTGIWLLPIFASPSQHGYDVTDYYAVNPHYGTMDDFRRLVDEAHRRGIRVIIDLVINHTSNQHPWFIQSQEVNSPYRDWYVWADVDPGWKGVWNNQVWYPLNGGYYYAYFWEGMPDLNYTNPDVTAEMKNVTRFWLEEIGIDGFRLDAIGSLIEEGSVIVETKASHDWFADFFQYYKGIKSTAMTIGEIWQEDAVVAPWVVNKQVDLAFDFDLSAAMLASVNEGNSTRIIEMLKSGTSLFPKGQYGIFLTNHDMKRTINQLGGSLEKAKAAASLYFALPGVPFVYYGEEIGLFGEPPFEIDLHVMQWSDEKYAGFSQAKPSTPLDTSYPSYNVDGETDDPNSLLSHYRTLISLRNNHPALRTGELILLSTNNHGIFACLRKTSEETILVIVNLTNTTIRDYKLSSPANSLPQGEYVTVPLIDKMPLTTLAVLDDGRILNYIPVPEIPPYSTIMMGLNEE